VPYQKARKEGLSANKIMWPDPSLLAIIEAVFFILISFSSDIYPLRRGLFVYRATLAAELVDITKRHPYSEEAKPSLIYQQVRQLM
jgi:hypothetical protein